MVKVKICGITNIDDAKAAVDAGADYIGFVFAKSPRRVGIPTTRAIINELPGHITTVGVFVGLDVGSIVDIMEVTGLDLAQVYDHAGCNMAPLAEFIGCSRVIRAFNIRSEDDVAAMEADAEKCDCAGFHMDAWSDGKSGGTGVTFNWDLAVKASLYGKPIILAGGLNPGNVGEAVERVHPAVVDVSSGVERSPGRKDHEMVREFIRNAKRVV